MGESGPGMEPSPAHVCSAALGRLLPAVQFIQQVAGLLAVQIVEPAHAVALADVGIEIAECEPKLAG